MTTQYFDKGQLRDLYPDSRDEAAGTRPAADSPSTVIIPAGQCFFTVEQISVQEARHLDRTLPWKLEELLLDPVEHCHVAYGRIRPEGTELVAVDRVWLQDCLGKCALAAYRPERILSQYSLVPWQAGQITVWQDHFADQLLLRDQAGQGLCCTLPKLQSLLTVLAQTRELPEAVVVYAQADKAHEIAGQCPELLADRLQVRAPPTLEQSLARVADYACNVLQGEFSAPLPWAHWWQQWRWVALLVGALFLTDLIATGSSIWQLQGELEEMRDEARATFETVMPGAAMVDARLQLERAVAGLGGSAGNGFVVLLTRMAPALSQVPGAEIRSMNYDQRTGTLQVLIRSADMNVVQTLRSALQAQGLKAGLVGSNSDPDGALSRLRIEG